ncbi:MAG: cell envelope integrity protein TolA [Gallionella sp.]|jgi:colicin import membrane protein|nr:cell envelope integrity protein TolA [Gallionella sp.]
MNATYPEPYKLPAGLLALVVHGAFFAFLYVGFAWQTQPPAAMSVDLWKSLPDDVAAPVVQAPPVVNPAPVAPPVPEVKPAPPPVVTKPDIVMPAKKLDTKKAEEKPAHPVEPKKVEVKPQPKPQPKSAEPSPAEREAARVQAAQAAQAEAVGRVVDEYMAKISSKIRRNIVMPPDVLNDARAEFSVTLLPGGSVLNARLTRSSGNTAYDNAVERAILKSQPLPLPADAAMFSRFRELNLKFKPVE